MTDDRLGSVVAIQRFPVKSLLGEALESVSVGERGFQHDRGWAVRGADGKFGSGKSTRRFRRMDGLFELSARMGDGLPIVRFPGDHEVAGDDAEIHALLSEHVGEPVTLAREDRISHFDEGPLHLLTTASVTRLASSLGAPVDARRFRCNLLIGTELEGLVEDSWIGQSLAIGDEVRIRIVRPMTRCVMVNAAQDDLPHDSRVLKAVTALNDMTLGVLANVERGGTIRLGQDVSRVADS